MAKLDRLLNLTIALLDATVPMTAEELRQRVPGYEGDSDEAFHRKFERDKDDLREMGIPVSTVEVEHLEQPRAAYTIRRADYQLPDPGLAPDELAALHLAATAVQLEGLDPDDAEEALRKLGGITGDDPGSRPLGAVPTPEPAVALFSALVERRRVTFAYQGAGRTVEPHRLQYERGHWYLTGHDVDRADRRTFRLDRLEGAVGAGPADSYDPPPHREGPQLRPWEMGPGEPITTELALDAGVAGAVLAQDPDLEVTERRDDGSVVVSLAVRNPVALRDLAVSLLDRAEVLSPPEMRAEVVTWLAEMAGTGR